MNVATQRMKNGKATPPPLAFDAGTVAPGNPPDYHERELRFIAAFRLRDAANRIATLVGMTRSAQLRAELLAMYDRLMAEERELLVRAMQVVHFKPEAPAGKPAKRTA